MWCGACVRSHLQAQPRPRARHAHYLTAVGSGERLGGIALRVFMPKFRCNGGSTHSGQDMQVRRAVAGSRRGELATKRAKALRPAGWLTPPPLTFTLAPRGGLCECVVRVCVCVCASVRVCECRAIVKRDGMRVW